MLLQTSQKIKTGIIVVSGLAILLLIIFFIGNQRNLFNSTVKLHINYRTVSGLQEGNFVRYAGINIGSVDLIQITNDTTVKVDVSIQKNILQFIKIDSRAGITNDGLMGDKLIQLMPGGDQSPSIKENGELIASNPFDMEKVMAKVERVINNLDTLSGYLSGILGKVNSGKGSLGKLINDDKLSKDLEATISSAKKTVKTIDKAAGGLNENMKAAKDNILLRGYFNKKEKKRIADSVEKSKSVQKPNAKARESKQN